MSLDIGQALRDGASRTAARNGLILAAVFAGIALLATVLFQSLMLALSEFMLESLQQMSPGEIDGLTQSEYQDVTEGLEQFRDTLTFAVEMSAGIAAGALLGVFLVAEAARIVAVRVFATDETETIPRDLATDNILLATLNGVVGRIIVGGLILVGLLFLVLPGIILAVLFFFLRQEIAINDKNFVQAMADSWRITKGNRTGVFIVGAALLIVSQLETAVAAALDLVSTTAGVVGGVIAGGLLAAFWIAVATRAYVQLDDDEPTAPEPDEDPYDAALGPDDLPR
jgi:hypothetical protein